jgi:hypothetical protein
MRWLVFILATLVFAALLIIDPVALAQLGYSCATGHCGVRPRTLAIAAAAIVAVIVVLRLSRRRPPPRQLPVIIMPKPIKPARPTNTAAPSKPRKPRAATARVSRTKRRPT